MKSGSSMQSTQTLMEWARSGWTRCSIWSARERSPPRSEARATRSSCVARCSRRSGSVAVSALQFAAFCRPATIGLFGIDISNAGEPRFYEKAGDTAGSGIAGAAGRIVAHFALARRVCAEENIEILNFSPVSALVGAGFPYDPRFAAAKAATA